MISDLPYPIEYVLFDALQKLRQLLLSFKFFLQTFKASFKLSIVHFKQLYLPLKFLHVELHLHLGHSRLLKELP
jgi:hypothetical protein